MSSKRKKPPTIESLTAEVETLNAELKSARDFCDVMEQRANDASNALIQMNKTNADLRQDIVNKTYKINALTNTISGLEYGLSLAQRNASIMGQTLGNDAVLEQRIVFKKAEVAVAG